MREIALFISLLGLILLLIVMNVSKPVEIKSQEEIKNLISNQKVDVSGIVKEVKNMQNYYLINLDKNITLYCYCKNLPDLKNKKIEVIGKIDTFQNPKIKVLSIKY